MSMTDDPEEQARREKLASDLSTIEAFRNGTWKPDGDNPLMAARRAVLDATDPLPQPADHDAHRLAWITEQARREAAAATAELHRNLATINRIRFDHAQREGQQPFTIVRDEETD